MTAASTSSFVDSPSPEQFGSQGERTSATAVSWGSMLERVVAEAPFLSRCSANKTATLLRPREYAVSHPYMQINRGDMRSWLIFDLDHPNCHIWDDVDLPAPNLIVANRDGRRSQLLYAITPVCISERARSKPIEYMKAVYDEMASRLKADPAYHGGPVAKTPGHPWWLTTELHTREYSLGELAEYVDLPSRMSWSKKPRLEDAMALGSRHCVLFELMRHYAYSIVQREREHGSYEHFHARLEAFALNSNQRVTELVSSAGDLRWSSLKSTARSVARWTWDRYTGQGDGVHRGVMGLDKTLPMEKRQRLAAERTHALRTKNTESRIRAACRHLQAQGASLAQVAIARVAGLTRQTVAAYKHIVNEVANAGRHVERVVIPLREAMRAALDVKHAAHQISARRKGSRGDTALSREVAPLGDTASGGRSGAEPGFEGSDDPCP